MTSSYKLEEEETMLLVMSLSLDLLLLLTLQLDVCPFMQLLPLPTQSFLILPLLAPSRTYFYSFFLSQLFLLLLL